MRLVEKGSTLLVSGPVESDEHGFSVQRLAELGVAGSVQTIAQNELLVLGDEQYPLRFRQLKQQRLFKFVEKEGRTSFTLQKGAGKIFWTSLPIELAEESDGLAAWYDRALRDAGVEQRLPSTVRDESSLRLVTEYGRHALVACISETGQEIQMSLSDILRSNRRGEKVSVTIPAQRSAALFIDKRSGTIISQLE